MSDRADAPSGVSQVPYPAAGSARDDLRRRRLPRLLLVAPEAPPPEGADELEDWVRLPADPVEVRIRTELLERRAAIVHERARVRLDEHGVLRRGDLVVVVTPAEQALLAVLLARPSEVVSHTQLAQAAARAGSTLRLSARVSRLRRRIEPVGLEIHAARGRGYLLEVVEPA